MVGHGMSACTCTPGVESGGWHEDRCGACLQREGEQWSEACAYARELGARLRRDNGVRHDLDDVAREFGISPKPCASCNEDDDLCDCGKGSE